MIQYDYNGGTNQEWKLVPLADGNYLIKNAFSGKVLDDWDTRRATGPPSSSMTITEATNQEWTFG